MEHRQEKPKVLEDNVFHCHSANYKFHMDFAKLNSGLRAHNPTTNTYGVNGRVSDRVMLVLFNDSVSTTQIIYSQIVSLYNDALEVSYLVISYSAEYLDDYRIVSCLATNAGRQVLGELRSDRNYAS